MSLGSDGGAWRGSGTGTGGRKGLDRARVRFCAPEILLVEARAEAGAHAVSPQASVRGGERTEEAVAVCDLTEECVHSVLVPEAVTREHTQHRVACELALKVLRVLLGETRASVKQSQAGSEGEGGVGGGRTEVGEIDWKTAGLQEVQQALYVPVRLSGSDVSATGMKGL